MPIKPCTTRVNCLGDPDSPIANYTSEAPDPDVFVGLNFGWDLIIPRLGGTFDNPVVPGYCDSPVSADDAAACAARQYVDNTLGNVTDGNGGWRNPDGSRSTVYFNSLQEALVPCADGSVFHWIVAPGYVHAASQAMADRIALSLAEGLARQHRFCLSSITATGCLNTPLEAAINITGGTAPFSFNLFSGSLPPGLDLAQTGDRQALITGTPITAGDYFFTIQTIESISGSHTERTYAITVLGITNPLLPDASVGQPYSQQLTVAGGTAPYTYALFGGGLPDGLTMDATGLITGTPTPQSGSANQFLVTVLDATGNTCQQQCQIVVSGLCGGSTDWTNPGTCRPRIRNYFNGMFVNSAGGICVNAEADTGRAWDGAFSVAFTNPGQGAAYLPANVFTSVSGLSLYSIGTFLVKQPASWLLQVTVRNMFGGILNLWTGQKLGNTNDATGVYTLLSTPCSTTPAQVTVEGFQP